MDWEGSGGPSREPGGVSRAGRGRESLLEGWEGSVAPSGGQEGSREPGEVEIPTWRARKGMEALPWAGGVRSPS